MGAVLFICSSVLILLLFSQLACSCSIDWFYCEKQENANAGIRACGHEQIKCRNSSLYIQFRGKGPWYLVENITFPEKTFSVRDNSLASQLQLSSKDCDFLYSFTTPVRNFLPSDITSLNSGVSFFNCKPNSYNFSADIFQKSYHSSYCRGYELYYSYQSDTVRAPPNCTVKDAMVEWVMLFNDDNSGGINFFLSSVGFSRRRVAQECFGCRMSSGLCSSVAAENSACSCNLECTLDKPPRTRSKILIGVGCSAFLALVAFSIFLWRKYRKNKGQNSFVFSSRTTSSYPSFEKDPEMGNSQLTHIFSYQELEEATNGFDSSKELGDGGFGTVYKGHLRDGRVVAVKRLYENNYKRVDQFKNEVVILSRLRHQNLVSLYGCTSRHSRELLLVYEYVCNGTVADHLHGSRTCEGVLTWPVRMNIAIETAGALAYLHAVEPQIIHRDVKTNNILLDECFHVKVADFGLSRLFPLDATHVSTAPQGTPGYLDPEYHQCYQLTDKSDVYSFGVVLVELISSKPAVDITRHRQEINLSNMAVNKIPNGLLHELVDPALGFDTDPEVRTRIELVAELTFRCLQADKDMRPTMEEVWDQLKIIANGDCREEKNGDADKLVKDDIYLLRHSSPNSPKTVTVPWVSRSTTPNSSA